MQNQEIQVKLKQLEEQLAKYKAILKDKMSRFHGVRHENSLSELRYTEVMVYTNRVADLEKEIKTLKQAV
jgi:hypothetical protein